MTSVTALRAELRLDAIKRDLVALIGRLDDAALTVPRHVRPHVETLAAELREPLQAILVPLCEGRQPPMLPRFSAEPMAREEYLDNHPRVKQEAAE